MKPTVSTHETFQGKNVTGTPVAFAHTLSPRIKSVFGVTQSDAYTAIPSGDGGRVGKSGQNVDDQRARIVEFEAVSELTWPTFLVASAGTLAPKVRVGKELELAE